MNAVKTNGGISEKTGFKSIKMSFDGFKGKPAKIKDGDCYVADNAEQLQEYKDKGYCTKVQADDKD